MNDKRKEYLKKWREDNKEHIRKYKKEYAKTHDSSFKKMQQKNKQLKEEYNKIQKAYESTFSDYQELKKQLYELGGVDEFNKHLLTQQKEFIKWLEEEEKKCYESIGIQQSMYAYKMFVEVLQKYKEIIGVSNEKK